MPYTPLTSSAYVVSSGWLPWPSSFKLDKRHVIDAMQCWYSAASGGILKLDDGSWRNL